MADEGNGENEGNEGNGEVLADLTNINVPPDRPEWRARAVALAAERGLIGQARIIAPTSDGCVLRCVSATEPTDHLLVYRNRPPNMVCDCPAGQHGKPCGHAGAALLVITDPPLAPERKRNPDGRRYGGS